MAEHDYFKTDRWSEPASLGNTMSPPVEACVEDNATSVLLRIPKQDYEYIEVDMSVGCTEAVIDVLSNALIIARLNKENKDNV